MNSKVMLISVILMVATCSSLAADWPQYLGPNKNSTSSEKGILRSWPEGGPKVLWTVAVGKGFGGPVIKDGKVYLLDRDDQVGDTMRCFDLSNGQELWKYGYEAPGSVMFPGSRSVPVVEGNYVYSCGHNGDLYCIDINTHKSVWNKNVWKDFGGGAVPRWAITQCPLIYGDLIIVGSQAPQAGVAAYDKLTGDVKWKTPSLGPVGYVSPVIAKIDGGDQLVMITASENRGGSSEGVFGINPKNGAVLWNYPDFKCIIPVSSAFNVGENRILIIGGYNAGAVMLKIEPQEDGSYKVNELFKTVEFGDHTKPPLLAGGYFYAQYTTNERRDGLVCMSMDGKIMWKTQRTPSFDKGSMILVDGLILATDGAQKLYLIEPDSSGFKPIASAELLGSGNQNWGPLALSNGKLLIRDQSQMKCIKVGE